MTRSLQDMTDEERWALFPILLSEHQDKWQEEYRKEQELIRDTIGQENIARINHIGSTAVPGLIAKPTIDILLEISPGTDIPKLITTLVATGYICDKQPSKPAPHLMFMKGYTPQGFRGQAIHLHVRYPGDWDELYFRDYLLTHPATAKAYGELKQALAVRYKHDRDAYTDAKTDFIRRITSLARAEAGEKYGNRL